MAPKLPAGLEIEIATGSEGWPEAAEGWTLTAIAAACAHLKLKPKGAAELSVLLTSDADQRALNRQWRGKDSATNVLSFPQIAPFGPVIGLIGDIAMARETLEREAEALGLSLEHHFIHLAVHGFLHILGYDHETEAEALVMEGHETEILATLGIADPYEGAGQTAPTG